MKPTNICLLAAVNQNSSIPFHTMQIETANYRPDNSSAGHLFGGFTKISCCKICLVCCYSFLSHFEDFSSIFDVCFPMK